MDSNAQIGRRLKLQDLHLFFSVVQWGSMAKAAAHLGMSQPAVSEIIAKLEKTLEVRLFDRHRHGVTPTMYGRALLQRSEAAFDELRQGLRDIEGLADPSAGEVRIGCPESIAASILPAIVQRFAREHPLAVVHVTQVSTATLEFPELRERKFDAVLARIDAPIGKNHFGDEFDVEKLFDDRVVLATGRSSKWAKLRKPRLADLRDAQWVMTTPETINAELVSSAFRAVGLDGPAVNVVTFSVHLRAHLMASGDFITALPHSALRANADYFGLRVLPIDLPAKPWPVAIVTLRNRTLSPIVGRFIDCVRKSSGELAF